MCNLLIHVFRRILRTLISLPLTVRLTAHLTRRQSQWLMSSTYFRKISCRTLSWWVRWPSIRVSNSSQTYSAAILVLFLYFLFFYLKKIWERRMAQMSGSAVYAYNNRLNLEYLHTLNLWGRRLKNCLHTRYSYF
jgi:hypothetical protein